MDCVAVPRDVLQLLVDVWRSAFVEVRQVDVGLIDVSASKMLSLVTCPERYSPPVVASVFLDDEVLACPFHVMASDVELAAELLKLVFDTRLGEINVWAPLLRRKCFGSARASVACKVIEETDSAAVVVRSDSLLVVLCAVHPATAADDVGDREPSALEHCELACAVRAASAEAAFVMHSASEAPREASPHIDRFIALARRSVVDASCPPAPREPAFDADAVNAFRERTRAELLGCSRPEFSDRPPNGPLTPLPTSASASASDGACDDLLALFDYTVRSFDLNFRLIRRELGLDEHAMADAVPVDDDVPRLRSYASYAAFFSAVVEAIARVADPAAFPSPTRVFRSSLLIDFSPDGRFLHEREPPFWLPPAPTPCSTSLFADKALEFAKHHGVLMQLTLPAGCERAVVVDGVSQHPDQAEVLLAPGASVLVRSVRLATSWDGRADKRVRVSDAPRFQYVVEGDVVWRDSGEHAGGGDFPLVPLYDVQGLSDGDLAALLDDLPSGAFPAPMAVPGADALPVPGADALPVPEVATAWPAVQAPGTAVEAHGGAPRRGRRWPLAAVLAAVTALAAVLGSASGVGFP